MGTTCSSPNIPQPPRPFINVRLSTPSGTVFRPYSVVTGEIALTPITDIAPHAIEVSLIGQAVIWYRLRYSNNQGVAFYKHWRDNAPLFEATSNLLPISDSEQRTLEAGHTYTYPFLLQFPEVTPNCRRGQYKKDRFELWAVGPHNLPPSFLLTKSGGSNEEPNYAKIEYAVSARLICPGVGNVEGKSLKDLVVRKPVLFMPSASNKPSSFLDYPKIFKLRTSALAGRDTDSIGRRKRMRDRVSRGIPKLEFEVSLKLPDRVTSGSGFRFSAAFKVISKSDNVSHIPAVTFSVQRLDLVTMTAVRVPNDKAATGTLDGHHLNNKYVNLPPPYAPYSGSERRWGDRKKTRLNDLPESATQEVGEVPCEDGGATEQGTSCEAWFTARVPGSTLPSFRSFAITRTYKLLVKLGIEVGGKKFKHHVFSEFCEVESAQA
jgi:hypothetical protein